MTENSAPLSVDQLIAVWKSATDESYWRPFFERPDSGIEAHSQAWEQYARASKAIDVTTQAMFIKAWSGQSAPPASGANPARVELTITRTSSISRLVQLQAGQIVEHVTTDYSPTGAIEVTTGRLYVLSEPAVLMPGDAGPLLVQATSDRPGYGYNSPLPGTIRRLQQFGATASGAGAQIIEPGFLRLLSTIDGSLTSQSVGQYIEIQTGPNAGQIRRVVSYEGPNPPIHQGQVGLDGSWVLDGSVVGDFQHGEIATQATTGASGTIIGARGGVVAIDGQIGEFAPGYVITGATSGATLSPSVVEQAGPLTADASVSWRVLSWDLDLGVAVTNLQSPEGGTSAMLDELGAGRGIDRNPGESDDVYRDRVWQLADVVSPNAVIRSVNRILAPLGAKACLREVGTARLPGFFYDAGSSSDPVNKPSSNFAYDFDFDANPRDRFKLMLSYRDSRAFFLVGVPRFGLGDFGFAFDATNQPNAYDVTTGTRQFFDGRPLEAIKIYTALRNALNAARAGGVGAELYIEDRGCE